MSIISKSESIISKLEEKIKESSPCYVCIVRPLCIYEKDMGLFGFVLRRNVCFEYGQWRNKILDFLSMDQYIWFPSAERNVFFSRRKNATSKM